MSPQELHEQTRTISRSNVIQKIRADMQVGAAPCDDMRGHAWGPLWVHCGIASATGCKWGKVVKRMCPLPLYLPPRHMQGCIDDVNKNAQMCKKKLELLDSMNEAVGGPVSSLLSDALCTNPSGTGLAPPHP